MLVADSTPALPHPVARSRGSKGQRQGRQARERRASRRGAATSTRASARSLVLAWRCSGRNGGRRRLVSGGAAEGREQASESSMQGNWALRFGRSSPSQTRTRQEVVQGGRGGGFDCRPVRSDSNGETRGEAGEASGSIGRWLVGRGKQGEDGSREGEGR